MSFGGYLECFEETGFVAGVEQEQIDHPDEVENVLAWIHRVGVQAQVGEAVAVVTEQTGHPDHPVPLLITFPEPVSALLYMQLSIAEVVSICSVPEAPILISLVLRKVAVDVVSFRVPPVTLVAPV